MKIYASSYGVSVKQDNNTSSIQAAINKAKDGDTVIFPSGIFKIIDTILIKNKGLKLIGDNTWFYQYLGKPALVFDRDQPTETTYLDNINLKYAYGFDEPNGMEIAVPIVIENCTVKDFFGNGIVISADVNTRPGTNASFSKLTTVSVSGCRKNGILFQGGDANSCFISHVDVRDNWECGINDSSFLGNYFFGCMAHNNGRNYIAYGANSRANFVSCYSEGGSKPEFLDGNSMWIGGMPTNGIELYGKAMFIYGNQILYNKDGKLMSLVKDIFGIYENI